MARRTHLATAIFLAVAAPLALAFQDRGAGNQDQPKGGNQSSGAGGQQGGQAGRAGQGQQGGQAGQGQQGGQAGRAGQGQQGGQAGQAGQGQRGGQAGQGQQGGQGIGGQGQQGRGGQAGQGVGGQAGAQGGQAGGQMARFDDRLFTAAAAESGMAEIAVSQLAMERASSDEVKEYARRMIEDHTQANRDLMSAAQTAQAPIARELSPGKRAELAILASKQGAEFDKAYSDQQVAAHICSVALFRAESREGQSQELKQFASETLPKLEHHLQMAMRLPGTLSSQQGQGQAHGQGQGREQGKERSKNDERSESKSR